MDHHRLHATASIAESFYHLFVNRRAYTLQSTSPHPETCRHYHYRPKARGGEAPPALSLETVQQHLAGELTLLLVDAVAARAEGMDLRETEGSRAEDEQKSGRF